MRKERKNELNNQNTFDNRYKGKKEQEREENGTRERKGKVGGGKRGTGGI